MGRDLTTSSASHQDPEKTRLSRASWRLGDAILPNAARLLAAMALGALLIALVYQVPTTHTVDIGGYDSAYVQGFYDPERDIGPDHPELVGSDGSARWTHATSYLLFPQAGLPAQIALRMRGWRLAGPSPHVQVLLNGTTVIGQFSAGSGWEDHTLQIDGGLLKPNDVVIEIRSETTHVGADDPREVGVLLDRATFYAGPLPITPYPPQLLYGALAAGLLWLLTQRDERRTKNTIKPSPFVVRPWLGWLVGIALLAASFLLLYRAQPLYPYPLLRLLPVLDGTLATLLVIRFGPALARRTPALLDVMALGGVGAWTAGILAAARSHVTLSVPGPEKDFGVFARRSAHLFGSYPGGINDASMDGVLRADGFYNLGYPLVLWLMRPFSSDNPFLAARLIAALSGMLLLLAGWWLARQLLGRSGALLALLVLALSPLVVEYTLYIGTDMPFAAACMLALALLTRIADCRLQISDYKGKQSTIYNLQSTIVVAAGLAAGAAFLIRHPGLLLLPFGWLCIWLAGDRFVESAAQSNWQKFKLSLRKAQFAMLLFTIAFLLAISPQLYVNLRDTGNPFFNQQAKNVWQGVFGDGDWGRWAATANDITLVRVVAQDPARFAANWWANVRGYFGTGGEDTREFGQATQLRLLGFPANWLALAGLVGWLVLGFRRWRQADRRQPPGDGGGADSSAFALSRFPSFASALLIWVALYIVTVNIGLAPQARFFLPLAPIYALAAAWALTRLQPAPGADESPIHTARIRVGFARFVAHNSMLIAGTVLLILLWSGFSGGTTFVTRVRTPSDDNAPGQPADEVAAAGLVLQTLHADERLVLQPPRDSLDGLALGKYSAIANRVVPTPPTDDLAALRASGAGYLLRATTLGPGPGELITVASAGGYTLYRITR